MKKEEDTVPKKEVKAVLFDLDGVLVDSFKAWHRTFNDIRRIDGKKPISKKLLMKNFGMPVEKDIQIFFPDKNAAELTKLKGRYFLKNISVVRLFPGSVPALKEIRRKGLKTGLISNSTALIVKKILSNYRLAKFFDVVVTFQDVKFGKPAPDMVLKACKILKIRPSEAILVGDSMNDMTAGKRAGCTTVGYRIKGDYKIGDLKEIGRFIYV